MRSKFSMKMAPLLWALAIGGLPGCGAPEPGVVRQPLTEQKAAVINQGDLDAVVDAFRIRDCTFAVSGGLATFTPSSELSQALFGDPDGSAHRFVFAVPPLSSGTTTVEIRSMEADFANTGVSVVDSAATVRLAFRGNLHISVVVPIFGRLQADVEIRPSSLAAALSYDPMAERVRVDSVTSRISHVTRNCGGTGWCNGLVDGILRANLATWIEAPLRDALRDALDDPDRTENLKDGLVLLYNRKDPQATPWEMLPRTLSLATSAFRFQVERTLP